MLLLDKELYRGTYPKFLLLETQEFQSIIDDWCLRRTKTLIADQLPQKGNCTHVIH